MGPLPRLRLGMAAVGAAIFDIFFAPETDRAGSASARTDKDFRLIEEMHRAPLAGFGAQGQGSGFLPVA